VYLTYVAHYQKISCDFASYCSTTYAGGYDFKVFLSAQSKETKAADWIVSSSAIFSLFYFFN